MDWKQLLSSMHENKILRLVQLTAYPAPPIENLTASRLAANYAANNANKQGYKRKN